MSIKETSATIMVVVLLFGLLSPILMVAVAQSDNSGNGFLERVIGNTIDIGLKLVPPDIAADLTNYLLSTHPDTISGLLVDLISRMDAKASADAVNTIIKDIGVDDLSKFLNTFLNRLDTEALTNMLNSTLDKNVDTISGFSSELVGNLDAEPIGKIANTLLADNPALLSDIVSKLDTKPLAASVNTLLNDNPKFLSNLVGEMDPKLLATSVNMLFNDHPAIANDLMAYLDPEAAGIMANTLVSDPATSEFVLETMDYIDNSQLIGLINDIFGKVFEKNYAGSEIIIAKGLPITIELPSPLKEMLGTDTLTIKTPVDIYAKAYITGLWMEEYPMSF